MIEIRKAIDRWKEFGINKIQEESDLTTGKISSSHEADDQARTNLIENSKNFRENATEDQRKAAGSLLKAFQGEIDRLSEEKLSVERAYLSLSQKISEIPDPSKPLEAALLLETKMDETARENLHLSETLEQYRKEISEVKNQELTIRSLKIKVKEYDENMEKMVRESLDHELGKLREVLEEQRRLEREEVELTALKLRESEQRAGQLQRALTESQRALHAVSDRRQQAIEGRQAELEMLMSELDTSNQKLAKAQLELDQARSQLDNLEPSAAGEEDFDQETIKSLESELIVKEVKIGQLQSELDRMSASRKEEARLANERETDLKRHLGDSERTVTELRAQLVAYSDYDELKREYQALKSIEFGNSEHPRDPGAPLGGNLQTLLAERNKALMSDNAVLRAEKIRIEGELKTTTEEFGKLESKVDEQRQLIQKLEDDLIKLDTYVKSDSQQNSPTVTAQAPPETGLQLDAPFVANNAPYEENMGLLPIVCSQRERFRMKVIELEEKILKSHQQNSLLESEMDRLKADNVKLYEKIRFLQSYDVKGRQSVEVPVESQYKPAYEDSLDPFRKFNQEEKNRKYHSLKAHDKATLGLGRLLISSPTSRTIFFLYLLILHLMVFLVLYKLAYTESCKRDFATDCVERFKEHMEQIHGQKFAG